MTKIKYVAGNLLDASEGIIAHGCNARGVMGSGVALAIKNKWPAAYIVYEKHAKSRTGLLLGSVVWATLPDKTIANCITQLNYGRMTGKQYVEYGAIQQCMNTINKLIQRESGLALPLIGAKRGGGNWGIISEIIEKELTNVEPVVYVLPEEWGAIRKYVI